jgi:uroporphyrinogen decarboxylase
MSTVSFTRQERLLRTIAGESADRLPCALWRRFPGDDQRSADFAASCIQFQRDYDWDLLNIYPADSACVADYPLQEEWRGAPDGALTPIKYAVDRSIDWTMLRPLDPTRGALRRLVDAVTLISQALSDTIPLVLTILSPLTQASILSGSEQMFLDMRTNPDRLHSGLNTLTENTLRLIDALRRLPVAGIALSTRFASHLLMNEQEYREFGLPYDRKIVDAAPAQWWLNLLHFSEPQPMLRLVGELRPAVVCYRDQDGEPDLSQGKLVVGGAVCGGWSAQTHLLLGNPGTIIDAAREAAIKTNRRRLILSAAAPVPVTAPLSNLRAARRSVDQI